MPALPAGTIELLVRKSTTSLRADVVAEWAIRALTDGFDSPSLRRAAGLDGLATAFEATPLFERALGDLELQLPQSVDELCRAWLLVLAQDIVDGTRTPEAALQVVHREVMDPLNHPADLMPWCYLWEGLDPLTFASLDDEIIATAARALARETLARSHV